MAKSTTANASKRKVIIRFILDFRVQILDCHTIKRFNNNRLDFLYARSINLFDIFGFKGLWKKM